MTYITEYTPACKCDNPNIIVMGEIQSTPGTFIFECKNCKAYFKSKAVTKMYSLTEKGSHSRKKLASELVKQEQQLTNQVEALQHDIKLLNTKRNKIINKMIEVEKREQKE